MLPANSAANEPLMFDTRDVAQLLKCSDRHVTNLRRTGRMPPAVKLGTIVRWPRRVILDWIDAGCPTGTCKRGQVAIESPEWQNNHSANSSGKLC